MVFYGVRICDFCGMRVDEVVGHLKLTKKAMRNWRDTGQMYKSDVNVRTWGLCKGCLKKLSGLESMGDKIKHDIELQLDRVRIENTPMKVLTDFKRKKKWDGVDDGEV